VSDGIKLNMKHKKVLSYVGLGALALAFYFGFNTTASAFVRGERGLNLSVEERATMQQKMFEEHANLLGISVDEVKNAWASGTNFMDLAKSKGISEETLKAKMKSQAEARMQAELSNLVSKGVITQAQADARLTFMKDKFTKMGDKVEKGKGKKVGHMIGFGFGGF
jgi:hypothetical protein